MDAPLEQVVHLRVGPGRLPPPHQRVERAGCAATKASNPDSCTFGNPKGPEIIVYGDSLGQPGTDGETYLGSQVHNARLILESWGVEPSALPEALRG